MRCCVYHDEEMNHKAAAWVRENAFQKGAPNNTAYSFCEWVNNDLLPASHLPPQYPCLISVSTSIRWLRHLGFKPQSHKNGVYIDGHEREEIVKHLEFFSTRSVTFGRHTNHLLYAQIVLFMLVKKLMKKRKSAFLSIMMSQSTTLMKDKPGCGLKKTIRPFCRKRKAVASWCPTLLTNMMDTSCYLQESIKKQRSDSQEFLRQLM